MIQLSKQIIDALIGQRIRIKRDSNSKVSHERLHGLGFDDSELESDVRRQRIIDKIYKISAAKVGAHAGQPVLMIRIQDWPLDFHDAEEFELLPKLDSTL